LGRSKPPSGDGWGHMLGHSKPHLGDGCCRGLVQPGAGRAAWCCCNDRTVHAPHGHSPASTLHSHKQLHPPHPTHSMLDSWQSASRTRTRAHTRTHAEHRQALLRAQECTRTDTRTYVPLHHYHHHRRRRCRHLACTHLAACP